MAATVRELTSAVDSIAPFRLAERWDNVGLLVGDPAATLTRVLLCIDATPAVIDEARSLGCEAIVAYHPVIFDGLKRVTAGGSAWSLVRDGIAVVTPHTAFDVAEGGTNDVLADVVGMTSRAPLRVTVPTEGLGQGRIGDVAPIERAALVERIKTGLGLAAVFVAGPTEGAVTKVAVGAGACGDLLDDVLAQGAGLYLTGEMRHHDALKAAARGCTVVCALHSNSERVALRRLAERLGAMLPWVVMTLSRADRDPFTVV